MTGMIWVVSGLVIGSAGYCQIAAHPVQGICALFLSGFLVTIGFEKRSAKHLREISG